jgi:hypothetical protein
VQPNCDLYNEDCIAGLANRVADDSIHLTVTSIPFEELFVYSGKLEDVGNNGSTIDIRAGRFSLNMRFAAEQLFRVTALGCNVCIHIQQLLAYKNQHGYMGRRDFRGAMIDVFGAAGFLFAGEVAIPKNPQAMANRLNLHSLQFKTGYARNACNLAPAPNDFVLIFQKPGQCENPVRSIRVAERRFENPDGSWEIQPEKNPGGWVTTDDWVKWARGTWDDILEIDVLDGWRSARETNEEKHVCPLQLELIRRFVMLYTNPIHIQPDVRILDPFMGIGSTAWVCAGGQTIKGESVNAPRNVIGFELKETYFQQSLRNVEKALSGAVKSPAQPMLPGFDIGQVASEAIAA